MQFIFRLIFLSCIPLLSFSQVQKVETADSTGKGIEFVAGLSWHQILEMAKAKNKMIFVDCYTTWCAPCKIMDKRVFPLAKVGAFFNEHFICFKVQMDKTKNDGDYVKKSYGDAEQIESRYSVNSYPTFLFLSPEGEPLHRASGAFSASDFLSIASDALSPETQSYTLASKYDPATMDMAEMKAVAVKIKRSAPELAARIAVAYFLKLDDTDFGKQENIKLLKEFSDNPQVRKIAKAYIESSAETDFLQVNKIDLLTTFLDSSSDKAFKMLFKFGDRFDRLKNEGKESKVWFSKVYVDYIIDKEEISPYLEEADKNGRAPAWEKLHRNISKKYGEETARRILIKGKMAWFNYKKDYSNYCKYVVIYMERYGKELETDWGYNDYAWSIFLHSTDKAQLTKALAWSNRAILVNPEGNWLDTYANLLYKLGKKSLAIRWQEVAVKVFPVSKELQANLAKMKNGTPTWLNN